MSKLSSQWTLFPTLLTMWFTWPMIFALSLDRFRKLSRPIPKLLLCMMQWTPTGRNRASSPGSENWLTCLQPTQLNFDRSLTILTGLTATISLCNSTWPIWISKTFNRFKTVRDTTNLLLTTALRTFPTLSYLTNSMSTSRWSETELNGLICLTLPSISTAVLPKMKWLLSLSSCNYLAMLRPLLLSSEVLVKLQSPDQLLAPQSLLKSSNSITRTTWRFSTKSLQLPSLMYSKSISTFKFRNSTMVELESTTSRGS